MPIDRLRARPLTSAPKPKGARLEVATYNVLYKTSDAQTKADLTRLMKRNGVINLQEFDQGHHDLLKWVERQGWGHFNAKHGPQEVILWDRSKYKLLASGGHHLNDTEKNLAPHGRTYPGRAASWVRLEDRATGHTFHSISVHAIAHSRGPKATPRVDAISKQQFRELAALTEKLSKHGPVILAGDFNTSMGRNTWPKRILENAGLRSNWQQLGTKNAGAPGTHGNHFIDHFFTLKSTRDELKLEDHRILRGLHSDHRAVEADYFLR